MSDRHAADLIPRCGKGFFSQSLLSVQTLWQCPYTPVCIRMHKHLTHLKDPMVHVKVRWTVETLKHEACTEGWVAQICCSRLYPWKQPEFPMREIPMGRYSCKSICTVLTVTRGEKMNDEYKSDSLIRTYVTVYLRRRDWNQGEWTGSRSQKGKIFGSGRNTQSTILTHSRLPRVNVGELWVLGKENLKCLHPTYPTEGHQISSRYVDHGVISRGFVPTAIRLKAMLPRCFFGGSSPTDLMLHPHPPTPPSPRPLFFGCCCCCWPINQFRPGRLSQFAILSKMFCPMFQFELSSVCLPVCPSVRPSASAFMWGEEREREEQRWRAKRIFRVHTHFVLTWANTKPRRCYDVKENHAILHLRVGVGWGYEGGGGRGKETQPAASFCNHTHNRLHAMCSRRLTLYNNPEPVITPGILSRRRKIKITPSPF